MTIEILICTIDRGIDNAAKVLMPPHKGISYLVSWQQTPALESAEVPVELRRDDVRVVTLSGKGLARNRNNAISHAKADICVLADDDVRYEPAKLISALEVFTTHPSLDIATFKYESRYSPKHYPAYPFDFRNRPRFYYVASIEIAFRRTSVQGRLCFNELFGLGAEALTAGEEEILMLDAMQLGLDCRFFPMAIVHHDAPSTCTHSAASPGFIMAKGALVRILNRYGYMPRYFVEAYRLNRQCHCGMLVAFKMLRRGGIYAKQHKLLRYDIKKIFQ